MEQQSQHQAYFTRLASKINNKFYYGWFIVISCLVISMALFGLRSTFGVFFKSLAADFDLNRFATSTINSAYMLFSAIFSLLGGWALDKYGPRLVTSFMGLIVAISMVLTSGVSELWQIFITYSFILAIGTGGAMPMVTAIVSKWFDKKRGQAIGLAAIGGGLGTVITAPIAALLISSLNWRDSYFLLGITGGIIVIIFSLLLLKSPSEIGMLPDGLKKDKNIITSDIEHTSSPGLSMHQAVKTRNFWSIFMIWVLYSSCLMFLTVHAVPFATDAGMSTLEAAAMLSVMGLASIIARFIAGKASDITGRKIPAIIGAVMMAISIIIPIWSHNPWALYLMATFFGAGWGAIGVAILTLSTDIFKGRNIGIIMGALEIGFLFGSAIGPAIAGYAFDSFGNYNYAFGLSAIAMIIVIIFICLTRQNNN